MSVMIISKQKVGELINDLVERAHLFSPEEVKDHAKRIRVYLNREPERKIVQLIAEGNFIYALANDGTSWKLSNTKIGHWDVLAPQLPQPE